MTGKYYNKVAKPLPPDPLPRPGRKKTMCRFLAYRGEPIFLDDLVCAPAHSLVHQSLHAVEAKTGTNGDGFGIGWYGERPEPGSTGRSVPPGRTRT
jgi:hypothetical protein